jgi:hypothetical protein
MAWLTMRMTVQRSQAARRLTGNGLRPVLLPRREFLSAFYPLKRRVRVRPNSWFHRFKVAT